MNNCYTKKAVLVFLFAVSAYHVNAQQSVTIGGEQLKDNAILWLNGNGSQGFLLPTVSSTNDISGSPDAGLLVYQTSDNRIYYFNGSSWTELGSGSAGGNTYTLEYDSDANQLTLLENGSGSAIQLSNDALSLNGIDLPGGVPSTDQILVYNGSTWEYQSFSPGGTDDQEASEVPVTPQNGVTSTDVQAALEELQSEINTNATAIAADTDNSATNEIQSISFDGGTNVLSLTEPGQPDQAVDLSSLAGGSTLTAGMGINITGGVISNAGDLDGSDDMLIGTYDTDGDNVVDDSENTQAIDGQPVDMAVAPTDGQVLKYIGGAWVPDADLQGSSSVLPVLGEAEIVTSNGTNTIAVPVGEDLVMNSSGEFTIQDDAVQLDDLQDNGANRAILANSSTGEVQWVTPTGDNQVLGSNGAGNLVFREATTAVSNGGSGIRTAASASDAFIATELSVREALDAIGGSSAWNLAGNTGTTPGIGNDFMGTLDAQDLVFGTNNVERLRIASDASSVTDNLISIPTVSGREIRFTGGTSAASITSDNQLDIGTSANALTLTGSSGILMTGNVSLNGGLPAVSLDITGTDAIRIPAGTDAQRPGTPGTGMIRFNSTSGDYEGYDGAVWNTLGVGGLTLQVAYDGGGNLIQQDGANNLEVLNSAGSLIQFYIDDATNNVGIGTSTPITTLDVRGESVGEGGLLNLGNSDNSHQLTIFSGRDGDPEPFIQVTDGTPLRFATTASSFTEIARFDNLGRFGIGTDLPLSTLDVNGDMRASGHLASSVVGGEGGQITLGHQGNTTATGEGNSTWNIDVESQNLRFFNLDAGGVGSIWMDINASTNLMTIGQTNANIDFRGPLLLSGDVGTAGQVLTSQGAGTPPVWSNASGITNLQGAYDGGGDVMMTAGSNIEVRTTTTSQIPFFIDEATGNVGFNTNAPTNSFEIREAPNQDRVFTVSGRNVALGDVDAGGTGGNMFIDGDGTGNLQYSNGAVWFNGSSGATPTSGSGTRFMWIPSRSSIRAGSIIGTEWDDGNVGSGSAAFGQNNTASGQASTAIGQANTASGSRSFVGGVSSTASGNGSTALGEGVTASTRGGFAVGHYNIGGGSATSFTSTDPVFEVGIGASSGSPENALTVLHGGNVGIGTATPLWGLEVEDNFSSNINPLVNFNRTGSNSATPIRMTNDASFINIGLTQNEDFAVSALGANIGLSGDLLNLDGSTGNLQVGGKIGVNSTTPTNGDIEIKQTTNSVTGSNGVIVTSATASNYWKYHTSGTLLRFSYWNGSVLSTTLSYTSGNSAWTFTSDRRQKKHITSIKTVLEKVLQLNPVRYRYKNMPDDSELNLGFIAQEVEPLFPELVENPNSENSYYSMEYSTVGVIAIKAIQEQQELIENQQKEIDALKAELSKSKLSQNKVETELEALKTQVDKLTNIIQAEAKNNNR